MKIAILKYPYPSTYYVYNESVNSIRNLCYEMIGFVGADPKEVGDVLLGSLIYPLQQIASLDYDVLLVPLFEEDFERFKIQLQQFGVDMGKVKSVSWLLQEEMRLRYEGSSDEAVRDTLRWWETHDLSVFNQYMDGVPDTYDEVFFDENVDLPYILFKTVEDIEKKMFFPKEQYFVQKHDKKYKENILKEQVPSSPHVYTNETHKVMDGDILIDAGVCEGNFALKYVDVASRIYLIEANPAWAKPLYYTFKDYENKVTLLPKKAGNSEKPDTVRLDDVIKEDSDSRIFLKMDIEGAEVEALHGASRLLGRKNVCCSLCCYHTFNDNVKIKSILSKYGYKTSYTDGHMVFVYSPDIWTFKDFRKGVIYGDCQ